MSNHKIATYHKIYEFNGRVALTIEDADGLRTFYLDTEHAKKLVRHLGHAQYQVENGYHLAQVTHQEGA